MNAETPTMVPSMKSALPMIDMMFAWQRSYLDIASRMMTIGVQTLRASSSTGKALTSVPDIARDTAYEGREQVIALGSETFDVNKKVVEGAKTTVHRIVVETPVEREVDLITRSVTIERRPPVKKTAEGLISELTTEAFDTTEIPVVVKGVAVVEEVVIRREQTINRQVIRDTIKHDDIRVEQPNRSLVPQRGNGARHSQKS